MRSAAKIAAVALLLASLGGCSRKAPKTAPPAAADAPSVPPARMATQIPAMPPQLPSATERPVKLDTAPPPETTTAKPQPHPRHTPRRKQKPATQETAQEGSKAPASTGQPAPPPAEPQVASTQQPSEMSPIGQISTANDSANTADRHALT